MRASWKYRLLFLGTLVFGVFSSAFWQNVLDQKAYGQSSGYKLSQLGSGQRIAWSTATDGSATGDIFLGRSAANVLTLSAVTGLTTPTIGLNTSARTVTLTSTNSAALAIGANGATNPVFQVDPSTASVATGIKVTGAAAAGGVNVAAISSGTDENVTYNAKGAGTFSINNTATGNITLARATGVTGALTGTSADSSALAIGANGATNPVLQVDASTASVATGVKVTGAAATGGAAIAAISSGTNENLTVDAKGSGTITLGATSTGNVGIGAAPSQKLHVTKNQNAPTWAWITNTTDASSAVTGFVAEGVSSRNVSLYIAPPSYSGVANQTDRMVLASSTGVLNGLMYDAGAGGHEWRDNNAITSSLTYTGKDLRIRNAYTDASNGEWGGAVWSSNILNVGTNANGTGTVRATRINANGGLVGIGPDTPGSALHVNTDQNAPTDITVENSTNSTASTSRLVLLNAGAANGSLSCNPSNYTAISNWAARLVLHSATDLSSGILYNATAGGHEWRNNNVNALTLSTSALTLGSGVWIASDPGRSRIATNVTNVTTTPAALTGLSATLIAGRKYSGEVVIYCDSATAADGVRFDFDGGTATMTSFMCQGTISDDVSVRPLARTTAVGTDITDTTTTGSALVTFKISFVCNAAGTFIPRGAKEADAAGATATFSANSYMILNDMP